jgi:D-threo-aldose 1-dehydrogenase
VTGRAGGRHFECQPASKEILAKVDTLKAPAAKHGVGVKAAAPQFSPANPVTTAVIPGATRPSRIGEDLAALDENVPAAFWAELRASGLVSGKASLPHGA